MKDDKTRAQLENIKHKLSATGHRLRHYVVAAFLVFVVVIYGIVGMRINTLLSAEPSPDAVSSQVKAKSIPKIDPAVVKQLQSLQDNSVNVQTLFEQARDNPFFQ